MYVITW